MLEEAKADQEKITGLLLNPISLMKLVIV